MMTIGRVQWDVGRFLQQATPIDDGAPPLTAAEIARRVGASPSGVLGALARLKRDGAVRWTRKEGWSWP